ncbi:hypothetical protein KFU94_38510 [Chloroflexi bacterium TSY]|nr:hypothetical protein [Chloroflexi bacterium TSY]
MQSKQSISTAIQDNNVGEQATKTLFIATYDSGHGLDEKQLVSARNTAIELFGSHGQSCDPNEPAPPIVPSSPRSSDVGFQYCHAYPDFNDTTGEGFGWIAVVDYPDKFAEFLNRDPNNDGGVLGKMYKIIRIPLIENGDENVYCNMAPKTEWGSG